MEIDAPLCEEDAVVQEISDQVLELACCYNLAGVSTLIVSSYCFTCGREDAPHGAV